MDCTYVHSKSGATVFFLVKDCSGNVITSSDCSAIRYSIHRIGRGDAVSGFLSGVRQPVAGHQNVSVPLTTLSTLETDVDTGNSYNFRYVISMIDAYPFPDNDSVYEIVWEFFSPTGEASVEVGYVTTSP